MCSWAWTSNTPRSSPRSRGRSTTRAVSSPTSVRLPCELQEWLLPSPARSARLPEPLQGGKSRLQGAMTQRVLIVDDSPDDIEMLKRFLETTEVSVLGVSDPTK